jgi:uncharacterized membrane protein YfcA
MDIVWRILLVAMPANVVGAYLTKSTSGAVLMIATAVVMGYNASLFLVRGFRRNRTEQTTEEERASADAVRIQPAVYGAGLLAGFLSGFLAIGGGIVLIPAFVSILKLPTRHALATSLLCVAAMSLPSIAIHAQLGHIDWKVALTLSAAVIPMSYLGARISARIRSVILERVFGILVLALAIVFLFRYL